MNDDELFDLWVGTQDEQRYVKIHWAYLEAFQGHYEACAFMSEIARLQVSAGGKRNGGWVVYTNAFIEKRFFMSRYMREKIVEILKPFGLITKQGTHERYPNAIVNYYRVDKRVFMAKMRQYLNSEKPISDMELTQDHVNIYTLDENIYTIEEVDLEEVEKIYAHPPKGDVRSASDTSVSTDTPLTSSSKKKAKGESQEQPPSPHSAPPPSPKTKRPPRVQVTITPPTTHNRADSPKPPRAPNDYQRVAGQVASVIFGIPEGATDRGMMKRVGLIAGYLWGSNKSMQAPRHANEDASQKADNIIADIMAFKAWWQGEFRDAHPPIDLDKFWGWWLKFWHNKRKSFYTPTTTTQYEGVTWNDYGDDFGDKLE